MEAYKRMPDNVLFRVHQVKVALNESDMPGPTKFKATCTRCGQVVRDAREVQKDNQPYCMSCDGGPIFPMPGKLSGRL